MTPKTMMISACVVALVGSAGFAGAAGFAPAPPPIADGATVYAQNCAACHQTNGGGIPGAFPALDGDKFVQGPSAIVAATVLKGRGGMPSFSSDLTDDQIAAVLSYVRSSWSNHAAPVPTGTVADARAGAAAEPPTVLPGH